MSDMPSQDNNPKGMTSRFTHIGFAVKAVAGMMVILLSLIALPLGVLGLFLFLYLHLLLHPIKRSLHEDDITMITAPIDGIVTDIRQTSSGCHIDINASLLASQICYAPIGGHVIDKIWMDGTYLPEHDPLARTTNARYDLLIQAYHDEVVTVSLYGTAITRYLFCPHAEGQSIAVGEPCGFGLIQSIVTLRLPASYYVMVKQGQAVFATQTKIAFR